jgi:hypothetical protein
LIAGLLASSICLAAKREKKAAAPASDFSGLMQKILDAWSTLDPAKAAPFYAQEQQATTSLQHRRSSV